MEPFLILLESLPEAVGGIIAAIVIGVSLWLWKAVGPKFKIVIAGLVTFITIYFAYNLFLEPKFVTFDIYSSSTKQEWMSEAAAQFNASGIRTEDGKRIEVKVTGVLSGASMRDILEGQKRPLVWSPGASSWVEQLNVALRERQQEQLISRQCQKIIYTPIGIAMWEPMAKAMGWPDIQIGFKDIVDLAADPRGWGRYGHPEWGKFKIGHSHPKYSNAGLLFMTAFAQSVLQENLNPQNIYSPKVKAAFRTLAQNTARYGRISTKQLALMAKYGPSYLHAVSAFEEGAVRYNSEHKEDLQYKLVFIFPKEGTYWSGHPYCILDQARGNKNKPEKIEAAEKFRDFLLSPDIQGLAVRKLLRPLSGEVDLSDSPLTIENGTDPRVTPKTSPPLKLPNSQITAAIIDIFKITKRKVTLMLLLDASGSMRGKKVKAATTASSNFIKLLNRQDRVGIMTFNSVVKTLRAPEVIKKGYGIEGDFPVIIPDGSTALHRAVCQSSEMMKRIKQDDLGKGINRIYGIVVLSDGEDTEDAPTANEMFTRCLPEQVEFDGVRINTIAFGDKADIIKLTRIAEKTGGEICKADTTSLENCYLEINAQ